MEVFRCNDRQPVRACERFCPMPCEQHVTRLLHDEPCELHRVLHRRDERHGARAPSGAVHHGGIELDRARGREHRAAAGVEERVVFERRHGGDHGVHAAAAARQNAVAPRQRAREGGAIVALGLRRHLRALDDAGAAVHGEDDAVAVRGALAGRQGGCHGGHARVCDRSRAGAMSMLTCARVPANTDLLWPDARAAWVAGCFAAGARQENGVRLKPDPKGVCSGKVVRTRRLRPLPQVARYSGSGDTADTANYFVRRRRRQSKDKRGPVEDGQ
jgi:hypothetical protein